MDAMGTMRDLDQIRERDDARESSKLVLVALGGLATACVLFAIGIMVGREADSARPTRHEDPLARLDALAHLASAPNATGTTNALVPALDDPNAVLAGAGQQIPSATPLPANTVTPPPATPPESPIARIAPAVPLAAMVEPSGALRENLAAPAQLPIAPANQARITTASNATSSPVQAGSEGAFTLQVSSFRTLGAAQVFAQRLRERGHRAFVSNGPGAGGVNWYRVRIGPFATQHEAAHYRTEFESRERLPTFVVRRDANEHTVRD